MRSINKKGQGKYYIIISLILGLMVLSLSLYFIFNEYFTEDEANWEVCRQSVLLRAQAVESLKSSGIANLFDLAESFPIKCQNEVIEIDYYDEKRANKEIADAVASCFSLYGKGELRLYTKDLFKAGYGCFICSRIHFEEDVIPEYSKKNLDVGEFLVSNKISKDLTYFDYIYWKDRSHGSPISKNEAIKKVTDASFFNASNGDIIVMYAFREGSVLGGSSGYKYTTHFFQPSIDNKLDKCKIIETIPS